MTRTKHDEFRDQVVYRPRRSYRTKPFKGTGTENVSAASEKTERKNSGML